MKKTLIIVGSIVGVLLVLFLIYNMFVSRYNEMVKKDEVVKNVWSQVETQYQRRLDLIPNIVSTVEGYANFEKSTLIGVVEARAKATSVNIDASKLTPEKIEQFQEAQYGLSSALGRLLVSIEKYPDLKAEKGFAELRAQLEGTENRIAVARNDFNTVVQDYNLYIRTFPTKLFASLYGFEEKGYFKADAEASKAPKVQFGNTNTK